VTSDLIIDVCLLGILVAGIAWLNLRVADIKASMTPEERERLEREVDDDMHW
jgi:hypothetical protein